ncbi:MAG TPA: flagellar export protein FliJ [Pirellulaceae bacterium]|nr:flagellar export protein FliJ [Pirellulaceae bacterium]
MAKFRYRLATLLRLREAARDEKRAQLAEAYRAAEILAGHLRDVEQELAELRVAAEATTKPGTVNIDSLLQTHRYELLLRAQKQMILGQQKQVAEEVDRRRLLLVEADRQVRVLEKLREHKLQEHQTREENRDMRMMDELASRARPHVGEAHS